MNDHDEKTKSYQEELPMLIFKLSENIKPIQKILKIPSSKNPQQSNLVPELTTVMQQIYDQIGNDICPGFEDIEIQKIHNNFYILKDEKKNEIFGYELIYTILNPCFR